VKTILVIPNVAGEWLELLRILVVLGLNLGLDPGYPTEVVRGFLESLQVNAEVASLFLLLFNSLAINHPAIPFHTIIV
jgi:hypothetical protein